MTVGLAGDLLLFLLHFQFLCSHKRFSAGSNSHNQLIFQEIIPLLFGLGDLLQRLVVLVEEELGQLAHVFAVLELRGCYLARLSEVSVLVQDLMHLVFDFRFKVEILQQTRDHLIDLLRLGVLRPYDLVLDGLLDGPKHVGVLDLLEDQLALLLV